MRKWLRVVTGLVLLWGALGILGYRLGWTLHFHRANGALLERAAAGNAAAAAGCRAGGSQDIAADGQLMGVLEIPTLRVTAPVAQGTSDAVLEAAVGHASSTPVPATAGTAVLLAHDVSYFSGIDQLKPGDELRYTSACATAVFRVTGHQVVRAGAPVPAQDGDGLVLDTCWPTDALWYTPSRYLVEAVQVARGPAGAGTSSAPRWPTAYTTPAPAALRAQGLDLPHNETPMGTLQLAGGPDRAWAQSPAPLAVQNAALAAYFGGLRAGAERRLDFWTAIAPGVSMPAALDGGRVSAHDSPLDVRITARGTTPAAVALDTIVTLAGGIDPGRHHMHVTESVYGLRVVVTSWEVQHA